VFPSGKWEFSASLLIFFTGLLWDQMTKVTEREEVERWEHVNSACHSKALPGSNMEYKSWHAL
jgi:hypothetical protein